MPAHAARYSQWQREAIIAAIETPGTSAPRIARAARAGTLEHPSGAQLGPFEIPENTVRSIARRARIKREAAQAAIELVDQPPRDAVEFLRRRLITAIDTEMTRIEIEQNESGWIKGDALRQVGRALRELAAVPGPNDPRPPAPGAKVNGIRNGAETRGGLAGKILAAHRAT
jgi:hypothetical protein